MLRVIIAVATFLIALYAATMSAFMPFLMLTPLTIVFMPFLIFNIEASDTVTSILFGFSYGCGIAMAAAIPAVLGNINHVSTRRWLASNVMLFLTVSLVGGIMRAMIRWVSPLDLTKGFRDVPPVDSLQTVSVIFVSSLLAAGLWYWEQRRKRSDVKKTKPERLLANPKAFPIPHQVNQPKGAWHGDCSI